MLFLSPGVSHADLPEYLYQSPDLVFLPKVEGTAQLEINGDFIPNPEHSSFDVGVTIIHSLHMGFNAAYFIKLRPSRTPGAHLVLLGSVKAPLADAVEVVTIVPAFQHLKIRNHSLVREVSEFDTALSYFGKGLSPMVRQAFGLLQKAGLLKSALFVLRDWLLINSDLINKRKVNIFICPLWARELIRWIKSQIVPSGSSASITGIAVHNSKQLNEVLTRYGSPMFSWHVENSIPRRFFLVANGVKWLDIVEALVVGVEFGSAGQVDHQPALPMPTGRDQ